jgi:hypothetical protein
MPAPGPSLPTWSGECLYRIDTVSTLPLHAVRPLLCWLPGCLAAGACGQAAYLAALRVPDSLTQQPPRHDTCCCGSGGAGLANATAAGGLGPAQAMRQEGAPCCCPPSPRDLPLAVFEGDMVAAPRFGARLDRVLLHVRDALAARVGHQDAGDRRLFPRPSGQERLAGGPAGCAAGMAQERQQYMINLYNPGTPALPVPDVLDLYSRATAKLRQQYSLRMQQLRAAEAAALQRGGGDAGGPAASGRRRSSEGPGGGVGSSWQRQGVKPGGWSWGIQVGQARRARAAGEEH